VIASPADGDATDTDDDDDLNENLQFSADPRSPGNPDNVAQKLQEKVMKNQGGAGHSLVRTPSQERNNLSPKNANHNGGRGHTMARNERDLEREQLEMLATKWALRNLEGISLEFGWNLEDMDYIIC